MALNGYYISNTNTQGEFLRTSLAPGEGVDLNWDVATEQWQTFSDELAEKKRQEGFTVTER